MKIHEKYIMERMYILIFMAKNCCGVNIGDRHSVNIWSSLYTDNTDQLADRDLLPLVEHAQGLENIS